MTVERPLLTPQLTERIGQLKVRAQGVVEGVLSGLHRSPHQGQSVEFAEHKEYAPGDELRHLDWKAFGKFDKYYVKRYEHETNLRAFLVVDASASMGFSSALPGGLSKLDVACTLAAALTFLLVRQQDAVGLLVLQGGQINYLPPRAAAGHLSAVLETLASVRAEGQTDLAQLAEVLSEKARRRAAVFVFSDLFDPNEKALSRLLQLRHQKNELSLFQVLDPAELSFPYDDPTRFESMEDQRALQAHPAEIRESYLEELKLFLDGTKRACSESRAEYELVSTDAALDRVLLNYLGRRERKGRA
jgi:uncharacterized protein (DUF58 family)